MFYSPSSWAPLSFFSYTIEVNGDQILQNIVLLCSAGGKKEKKKEIHTGLEQLYGE